MERRELQLQMESGAHNFKRKNNDGATGKKMLPVSSSYLDNTLYSKKELSLTQAPMTQPNHCISIIHLSNIIQSENTLNTLI